LTKLTLKTTGASGCMRSIFCHLWRWNRPRNEFSGAFLAKYGIVWRSTFTVLRFRGCKSSQKVLKRILGPAAEWGASFAVYGDGIDHEMSSVEHFS